MASKRAWLMKSEPESYSIDHLARDGETPWTGVRNFEARNFMREMRIGDRVLFYHSSCKEPGVYGEGRVASAAYPDPTQFDAKSPYFDSRAKKEKPFWELVDVAFVKKYTAPVLLPELRRNPKLRKMRTLLPGSRLSITPVTESESEEIAKLGKGSKK